MLTSSEKRKLRQAAHHLKPVVMVGQGGLSDPVVAEINQALDDHELIKIKFRGADREARAAYISTVCKTLTAEVVTTIGGIAVVYRKNPDNTRGGHAHEN